MAGDPEVKFTGFQKYFNTITETGRANISKTTLGLLAVVALYYKFKPAKKPAEK